MTDTHGEPATSAATRWARPVLAVYWTALCVATHWPRLDLGLDQVPIIQADKLLHFAAFGMLLMLVFFAAPVGRAASFAGNILVASAATTAYACLDEMSQQWFNRWIFRTFDAADLASNLLGVSGGVLAVVALHARHRRIDRKSHPQDAPHAFVGHAAVVGALTFVSRLLGLVRDAVIVGAFGIGGVTDAFYLAFKIPNLFRRLFGEGALSAAFIPIYTQLRRDDPEASRRFAAITVATLAVVLGTLTLAGEAALAVMRNHDGWSSESTLAIRLTMIMLPYMPMVCLVALLGAMLQVRGRFGPAAFAPVLLNLCMIAAATLAIQAGGGDRHDRIWFVAVAVLIAGLGQLVWQLAPLLRTRPFATGWAGCGAPLKTFTVLMLPMVTALAVFQINTLLDSLIAMGFSPKSGGPERLQLLGLDRSFPITDQGAVASLELAQRLYQFPLGVFGIALATAIFPALSHAAPSSDNSGDGEAFKRILRNGLRLTIFIGLPATAGLIIVRLPLVRVLFEHGRVDLSQSIRTASILAGYAAAVWAYSMTHVLTRAYYAVKNVRTPLIVSIVMVALNLTLNLTLIWPLGAAGLAWSTAISAVCQVVILTKLLRRHVTDPIDADVRRGWARSIALTAIMAAALAPVTIIIDAGTLTLAQAAGLLAMMVVGGVVIVAIGALILRSDELKWLIRRRIE